MREAASFFAARSESFPAGGIAGLVHDVHTVLRAWNNRRKLAKLDDLDDHLLADLGITRNDLHWALHLPFAVDPAIELQRRSLHSRIHGWRA